MSDPSPYVSHTPWARYGKRGFDWLTAATLILLASPILLLTVVAIKATSRGPLLFYQQRTGRNGVRFRPAKFRSMRAGRKHDIKEVIPLEHPHITPVGRFIRRFKIDELPQLFSVLAGDMALIGPRPTIPEQTDRYDDFQRRRLLVRPGLTGLAQVNSSALRSWDERIRYDVYYVQHHGLRMDLGILLKSILVVLLGEERFARPFDESPYGRQSTDPPA